MRFAFIAALVVLAEAFLAVWCFTSGPLLLAVVLVAVTFCTVALAFEVWRSARRADSGSARPYVEREQHFY